MQVQVGDRCCADPIEEGHLLYGVITAIMPANQVAWSNLIPEFCGDIPTKRVDGVWVFTSF